MELVIMIGIVSFFGIAAISTVAHRNTPPTTPILVVRAEQVKDAESGDAGFGIFLLIAVIIAAIWIF